MPYFVETEDGISRSLRSKNEVIDYLLFLIDRIDTDLGARVLDRDGNVLFGWI